MMKVMFFNLTVIKHYHFLTHLLYTIIKDIFYNISFFRQTSILQQLCGFTFANSVNDTAIISTVDI